jgi:uncharacterized membrane protein
MSTRLALYEIARVHQLDAAGTQALFDAAGLAQEPPQVRQRLWPVTAILAAALGGFGLILWLAANWDTLGRLGRFALLQGVVVVMCVGAAWRPALRAPLGLLALLCIGGLFAYFGQTYQTGADAWQLFAVWAALALPLCLGARSDVLWAPWALITLTAVSLWDLCLHGPQLAGGAARPVRFCPGVARRSGGGGCAQPCPGKLDGCGALALRTSVTLSVMAVTLSALGALFHKTVAPHYALALALMAIAAAVLALRKTFDVFGLSAVALGLNTLLVAGLVRLMFWHIGNDDPISRLLLVGLVAAGLLAATVSTISRLARRHAQGADA